MHLEYAFWALNTLDLIFGAIGSQGIRKIVMRYEVEPKVSNNIGQEKLAEACKYTSSCLLIASPLYRYMWN